MRTTLRKLKAAKKHLPSLDGRRTYKIGKIYATTIRKVKRRPLISLGTAVLAVGALSGMVAWLRSRR